MRFFNYFLYQLIGCFSDSNPYEDMRSKLEQRLDPFGTEVDPVDLKTKATDSITNAKEVVDLQQTR